MKSLICNRVLKLLMTPAYVAMIIIATAISIELLYQGFQFIETTFQTSTRQASQYLTQLAYRH